MISTEIERLQQAKSDIKTAIEAKGVTVPSSALLDTYDDYVAQIQQGGGGGGNPTAASKDVNFIDYDGTIRYSYTAAEFAQLTALPANPTHEGLTAQGWNWTLANAKTYVAAYGKLNIGQMYVTSDGKTRIYIHLEKGRLSPMLGVGVNGTVVVDWGDNSATTTLTGSSVYTVTWTSSHNYVAAGDYIITLTVTGSMRIFGASSGNSNSYILSYSSSSDTRNYHYASCIQKVEVGANTNFGDYAFNYCYNLTSITIPSGVTTIGYNMFQYCSSLASVTIPSDVTSIGSYAFRYCYGLESVMIPNSVTTINTYAFQYCSSLNSVMIPSSVTSIPNYMCGYCYGLASVIIPSSVTSIGSNTFQYCYGLASVTIPSSVTSISSAAFRYCYGIAECHILATTPPTLSTNVFNNNPADFKIYVPSASVSTYKGASNWSTYASQIYGE